jgi:hypothetical protein
MIDSGKPTNSIKNIASRNNLSLFRRLEAVQGIASTEALVKRRSISSAKKHAITPGQETKDGISAGDIFTSRGLITGPKTLCNSRSTRPNLSLKVGVVSQFSPHCTFTSNDKISFSLAQVSSDIIRINAVPVVIASSWNIRIRVATRFA